MRTRVAVLAIGALLLSSMALFAHHAFQAEYDATKPVKVTGTVKKVEWTNPHIWFYVDVKDESGKVTNWNFELGSPNVLKRQGWSRDSLKVGDVVTVEAYLAKDGSNLANARRVTLADGRKVFNGSVGEGAPQQ